MQTITISGFVDNGKTQFSKACVQNPHKLDSKHREKKHAITLNLNMDYIVYKTKKYLLLDSPGHNMLLPKALRAIVLADIHILVVSCNQNDSGLQNLNQYIWIYKKLGIKNLIVVITKIDLITKQMYYDIQSEVLAKFNGFSLLILPFTCKNPQNSVLLFKSYLSEFKYTRHTNVQILKSYNTNKPHTNITKLVPTIIGLRCDQDLSLTKQLYIGPVYNGTIYEVKKILIKNLISDENIHTIQTNINFYHGRNNILQQSSISLVPFTLMTEYKLPVCLPKDKRYYVIINNLQTEIKIKKMKKNFTIVSFEKPMPNLPTIHKIIILRKAQSSWQILDIIDGAIY